MRTLLNTILLATLTTAGFAADPPKPPKPPSFAEVVVKSFDHWDLDKNGKLSPEEINNAIADPSVKGPEAAAIAALRRGLKAAKGEPPKLTADELAAAKPERVVNPKKAASAEKKENAKSSDSPSNDPPKWQSLYMSSYQRITRANRELFAGGKPSLDKLRQGRLGDCYCLAPLGAVCFRDPDDVVKMITPTKDGKYSVKIGKETIVVTPPTDAELALSGSTNGDGMWVNVYEKAIGEWRTKHAPARLQGAAAIDLLGNGGSTATILSALTGVKAERFSLSTFKSEMTSVDKKEAKMKELRASLEKTFADHRLVTTGTSDLKTKPPNINIKHAYAVLSFDKASDKLTLWNPHGQSFKPKGPDGMENGYTTSKGRFQIPLADFVKIFNGVTFEGARKN